jgi:serine-type D-Ala-D-Ala carboxypeptidase/endopeptidase (penicillin-binding protein 4)
MNFRTLKILALAFYASQLVRCAWSPLLHSPDPVQKLHQDLDYLFSDPCLSNAFPGVAIQSLRTGEYLYLMNEHKLFVPGSNVKLFTSAAALLSLGPDYRYETTLDFKGTLQQTLLSGDLYLRGSGDPTLGVVFADDSTTDAFNTFVSRLQSLGVQSISGRLIGDDSAFEDERWGKGWAWDYLDRDYAAPISALSFHENCIDIHFMPGDSTGTAAGFTSDPDVMSDSIINNVMTMDSSCHSNVTYHKSFFNDQINFEGQISIRDSVLNKRIPVTDPARFTTACFSNILKQNFADVRLKIKTVNDFCEPDSTSSQAVIAVHSSRKLSDIVKVLNQKSQNLYAELVLRTMGRTLGTRGSVKAGLGILKKTLNTIGIDSTQYSLVDGSGLSRKNYVTPSVVVNLLRAMRSQTCARFFVESLPLAGTNGTLSLRMKDTAACGNVRAKTGTLDQVKSLSGYVTTRDGEELAFAILINNFTAPGERTAVLQDAVCERLANYSRRSH